MPSIMPVSSILHDTARQICGGARSFPVAYDATIQRDYGYQAPNIHYEKLFHFQAARASQQPPKFSAGWLIPDDRSDCNPVFVAHSLLSAIWLLHETLPEETLNEAGWQKLVNAATELSTNPNDIPPSAQKATVVIDSDEESDSPLTLRKRTAPRSSTSSSPKRSRIRTSTQEQSPAQPPELSPVYITTVTSNNRRAERARQKKRAAREQQSIGLKEPPESAEAAEKIAYRTITPADSPDIAWLIKQPMGEDSDLYKECTSPYKTACDMLTKARAIGNQPALYAAATFLRSWRHHGTPVPSRTSTFDNEVSSPVVRRDDCDRFFQRAWTMSHVCEQRMATLMIEYRWAMALLGRAYDNKISQIKQADQERSKATSCNRRGRGTVRGEAIDDLLQLVSSTPTPTDRRALRRRLARATRWFRAAEVLGWGSLCLMPTDGISNRWAEKDLPTDAWNIWLQLVKKVNPEAHSASIAFDNWVGEAAIWGGPIQSKEVLCIEEKGPMVVYEIEEIADSTDEQESDMGGTAQSTLPRPLRQLTLLELFRPQ